MPEGFSAEYDAALRAGRLIVDLIRSRPAITEAQLLSIATYHCLDAIHGVRRVEAPHDRTASVH